MQLTIILLILIIAIPAVLVGSIWAITVLIKMDQSTSKTQKKHIQGGSIVYCRYCGQQLSEKAKYCDNCGAPQQPRQTNSPTVSIPAPTAGTSHVTTPQNMETWKLVSGIISLALSLVVLFQSCTAKIAGVYQKVETAGDVAGAYVGLTMIVVGIVSIATRKTRGGNIALIILCALGFIVGITGYGLFLDLIVWSVWLLVIAVLAFVCLLRWHRATRTKPLVYTKPTWMK